MLTRIAPVQFGIRASLTTQGQVAMSGNANIDGADQIPTGWASCDPPAPAQAGVRDQGGNVSETGNGTVRRVPPFVTDPPMNNNTFTTFAGPTYASCRTRAN